MLAAVALGVPAVPSYAADPVTDLYVETPANGGLDTNDCLTIGTACATVGRAIIDADATGTTIHVGAGEFDGPVRPGVSGKSVTIDGAGADQTTLIASEGTDGYDGTVVELSSKATTEDTLSDLTVSGGLGGGIAAVDPDVTLHLDHVVGTGGGCDLYVAGSAVDVTDSTFSSGGDAGGCGQIADTHRGDVAVDGGTLSLTRTQILEPAVGGVGLAVNGGTVTVDRSLFDSTANQDDTNDSKGVAGEAGQVTVTRSTVEGFGEGVLAAGATVQVSDSTFFSDVVGLLGTSGAATVVRSTFDQSLGSVFNDGDGTLSVAGSVLGSIVDPAGSDCSGPVTDLGYNLAADGSCAFTQQSSHGDDSGLGLQGAVTEHGAGVPTDAILNPSDAVDAIPADATYGDPAAPLCPASGATDLRGVPRPAGGACDAGSFELAATSTALTGPSSAAPGTDAIFTATVTVPPVIDGLETPDGTVTFTRGAQALCSSGVDSSGVATCTTADLPVGADQVSATFVPAGGTTLHGSTATPHEVLVGSTPTVRGPGRVVVHVGRRATITLRSTGRPAARFAVTRGRAPAGMRIVERAGRLTVSGRAKPSAVGRHTLRVSATNILGRASHTLTIVVRRH